MRCPPVTMSQNTMRVPSCLYVENEALKEFTCIICHEILHDPCSGADNNSHLYCRSCITQWLRCHATCPMTRAALTVESLRRPSWEIKGHGELAVHCPSSLFQTRDVSNQDEDGKSLLSACGNGEFDRARILMSSGTCSLHDESVPLYSYSSCAWTGALVDLPEHIRVCECMRQTTTRLRKQLINPTDPDLSVRAMVASGIVPAIVELLQVDDPKWQNEAAWVLTNIASVGDKIGARAVIEAGAVPVLIKLIGSPLDEISEISLWAISNVAGDGTECRDEVLMLGALEAVIQRISARVEESCMSLATTRLHRRAAWTILNLCRGIPSPKLEAVRPALPLLAKLLYSKDSQTVEDACWALSHISHGSNGCIQATLDSGAAPRLLELMREETEDELFRSFRVLFVISADEEEESSEPIASRLHVAATQTLGNIVTGDELQTQRILDLDGALPSLLLLLCHRCNILRKEACWAISNIAAGSSVQIQALIDAGVFSKIMPLLQSTEDTAVQKEALWIVANAASGCTPDQNEYLVHSGAIPQLCALLLVSDTKTTNLVLKTLDNIQKGALRASTLDIIVDQVIECDGMDAIESLAHSGIADFCVSTRALKLLRGLNSVCVDNSEDDSDREEEEYVDEEDSENVDFPLDSESIEYLLSAMRTP